MVALSIKRAPVIPSRIQSASLDGNAGQTGGFLWVVAILQGGGWGGGKAVQTRGMARSGGYERQGGLATGCGVEGGGQSPSSSVFFQM